MVSTADTSHGEQTFTNEFSAFLTKVTRRNQNAYICGVLMETYFLSILKKLIAEYFDRVVSNGFFRKLHCQLVCKEHNIL